jgi:hypothetical protein
MQYLALESQSKMAKQPPKKWPLNRPRPQSGNLSPPSLNPRRMGRPASNTPAAETVRAAATIDR